MLNFLFFCYSLIFLLPFALSIFLLPFTRPAQYGHLLDCLSRCGLRPPLQEQSVQLFILTQNFGESSGRRKTIRRQRVPCCEKMKTQSGSEVDTSSFRFYPLKDASLYFVSLSMTNANASKTAFATYNKESSTRSPFMGFNLSHSLRHSAQ